MVKLNRYGSVWDRNEMIRQNDDKDTIERLLNEFGDRIQNLVAEGQLTPTQYANLLQVLNNLISRGNVTVDDIDFSQNKFDASAFSDEFLIDLANGEINTTYLEDGSVSFDKTNFSSQIAVFVENLITNSLFTKDSDGDGVADGWVLRSRSTVNPPRISNGTQYWTPEATASSDRVNNSPGADVFSGHQYYIAFEQSNVGSVNFTGTNNYIANNIETDGKISLINVPPEDGAGILNFYVREANVESSISKILLVDLTETFGAGNEPTLEYFEFILNLIGAIDGFEGTLNLTDANKNSIITARDLKVHDSNQVLGTDNVNDALLDLADGAVKSVPGKNLYNPENNVDGTIATTGTNVLLTIVPSDQQHVTQKIRIKNDSDVTMTGVLAYAITDLSDIVVRVRDFIRGQGPVTIPQSDVDLDEYYLWISQREEEINGLQIEKNSVSTPYEPYKPVDAVYSNGVKLFDYPLTGSGSGDKKKELYDLAKADLKIEDNNKKINFLSNNAQKSHLIDAISPNDSQNIPLTDNQNPQKMILHLHKRIKEDGFGTFNNAYLPNAKNDFSDVRITTETGEVLPYRMTYLADDFDIVPYDWLRTGRMASATFMDSNGDLYQENGEIKVSKDKGNTWNVIPGLSDIPRGRVNLIAQDDTMFFNYDSKLFRSEAPYTDYQMVLDLNPDNAYDSVMVSGKSLVQHPDGELFAGLYQGEWDIKIYKSTDNGLTWQLSTDLGDAYQHVHGMFVDEYANPPAVYAGLDGGGGVLKSTDKGATWIDLRVENPELPQSTDYGVRYADPSGYRLLGGETPIVGGHSIIKTFDDETFYPVLSDGISVNYVIKLGNRMFATGSGSHGFRNGAIYISRDDAENWEGVYRTAPLLDLHSANDGYRYMEQISEDEILVGPQSFSRPPLRIFGSGNYAEIIVDVPEGTNALTVESGHGYPNELPISNDSDFDGEKLVHFELNENGSVIKELVSGKLFEGNFEWIEGGKKLSYFNPVISTGYDGNATLLKSLTGYNIDGQNFNTSQGVTISFWSKLSLGTRFVLLESDSGDRLEIVNGYQLHLNGSNTTSFNFRVIPEPFVKHDILFKNDGSISIYTNGLPNGASSDGGSGVLNALENSNSITYLNNIDSNETDAIQHFMIRKGIVDETQLLRETHAGLSDNV